MMDEEKKATLSEIVSIRLRIGQITFDLSLFEAEQLYNELGRIVKKDYYIPNTSVTPPYTITYLSGTSNASGA